MTRTEEYRAKAAEVRALAAKAHYSVRDELLILAHKYDVLAEKAEKWDVTRSSSTIVG